MSKYRNLQKQEHHTTLWRAAAAKSAHNSAKLGVPSSLLCHIPTARTPLLLLLTRWTGVCLGPAAPAAAAADSAGMTSITAVEPSSLLLLLRSEASTAVLGVVGQGAGMVPSTAACRCCLSRGVSILQLATDLGRNILLQNVGVSRMLECDPQIHSTP